MADPPRQATSSLSSTRQEGPPSRHFCAHDATTLALRGGPHAGTVPHGVVGRTSIGGGWEHAALASASWPRLGGGGAGAVTKADFFSFFFGPFFEKFVTNMSMLV